MLIMSENRNIVRIKILTSYLFLEINHEWSKTCNICSEVGAGGNAMFLNKSIKRAYCVYGGLLRTSHFHLNVNIFWFQDKTLGFGKH